VADQDDVRRIALALPDTSEANDHFRFSVLNKGKQKGFIWAWNERVEPKKPRVPRADVLAVRVVDQVDKEALLASDERKFFTEPHYNGFPAVLVRLPLIEFVDVAETATSRYLVPGHGPRGHVPVAAVVAPAGTTGADLGKEDQATPASATGVGTNFVPKLRRRT